MAAKTLGFDAVEFWWPFRSPTPAAADVRTFVNSIKMAHVQLIALNFAAGTPDLENNGLLSSIEHKATFRANVQLAVNMAGELGTRAFNALYGNRLGNASEQHKLAVENLVWAAEQAATVGAVILIEPLSGAPNFPVKTVSRAVKLIEQAEQFGARNVRLLLDLYHVAVNGEDAGAVIDAHADMIGHVQIADAPGRHEPGSGTLDINGCLRILSEHGYQGHVAIECIPSQGTAAYLASLGHDPRLPRPSSSESDSF